ncbi:MAG: oxidase [Alphaproteobacteria bacterium]|nr:MAG: oxidase [Alphaproteobacteria bacterium]
MSPYHPIPYSRRAALALFGAAVIVPALRPLPALAAADRPALPLPPLDPGEVRDGQRVFRLSLQRGTHRFMPGVEADTIGINAPYLGPVLAMRRGERVRMEVTNGIGEPATLHWHGLELPAAADGGPHQVIAPGATWVAEFEVRQRAGTYWFHAHRLGATARHVWFGMAGVIRIEEEGGDLPAEYGHNDLTLVLQDRWFTSRGGLLYRPNGHDVMMGMSGDVGLANGAVDAAAEVPAGLVRLRLVNGSNASIYRIGFSDRTPFWLVASDGGLLAAPVRLREMPLAPGERIEIVTDLSDGTPRELIGGLAPMGMMGGGMMGGGAIGGFRFATLVPGGAARRPGRMPERLSTLEPAAAPASAAVRRFVLDMAGMGPMAMLRRAAPFTINGQVMDPGRIDHVVPAGAQEVWEFVNRSGMAHPMHIHNTQFRILERDGAPPHPAEAGCKDTVVVPAGGRVRLLARFPEYSDPERPYMYHCHILEHEDAGMMGQFTVV